MKKTLLQSNTGRYIKSSVIKLILKDLIAVPGDAACSRADLILAKLMNREKGKCYDAKCHVYYGMIKYASEKLAKENRKTQELMKKVYGDYPILRKALVPTLRLVLRSIEEYGITTPQRMSAPLLVEFELTKRCNLRCKHCYASAGKCLDNELGTRQAKMILDQISSAGTPIVCFTGGEPMLREDFFELVEHANGLGLGIVLMTNGTLITEDKARKLKQLGVGYVRISLDGTDAKTHDWLRGVPGAHSKAIVGIKNSIAVGLKTGIGSVVIRENINEMGGMIDLIGKLGCSDFTACRLFPLGKGESFLERLPTKKELVELEELFVKKAATYPNLVMNPLTIEGRTHTKKNGLMRQVLDAVGGCPAGIHVCAIGPEGKVRPCALMTIEAGDLNKDSFEEIWKQSRLLNELRDRTLLKGKCSKCEYRYSCGGCRATAYGYKGDYLESDPITCMLR